MRSRDGDRYFTRRLCSLIFLFFGLSLFAEEYLISYRYVVRDATLYNEQFFITPSMKKCLGAPQRGLLLLTEDKHDIKEIITHNRDLFLEYIHKLGMHVVSNETVSDLQNSSTATLTLRTTCFKVDFNDAFVTITPLR